MSEQALDYTGRTVIVTGGTKGIGRSITERFLVAGANVVICARNPPMEPVEVNGRSATFVACDVRDSDQIAAVVEATTGQHGRIDVLINNAGGAPPVDSADASPKLNEKILALNLLAPIHFAQAVYPAMTAQDSGGVIINIASVSGMRGNPKGVAYGAAKAGLINATETLAMEWAPKIRVNTLTAGLILTPDARAFYGDDESVAKVAATIPMGRLGKPDDVADGCLLLASPLAAWVTGANFQVHGGGEVPSYLMVTDAL